MDIQITLIDSTKTYKPHSTILRNIDTQGKDYKDYYTEHKAELINRAVANICHQLKCSYAELKKQGFTQVMAREYDLKKIKQQQLIKLIKREHEKRGGNNE